MLESDLVGYLRVKVLRLVLVLVLEASRLLVKLYRLSLFRRERWLEMTDMVGGGGVLRRRTDKQLSWFRERANVGGWRVVMVVVGVVVEVV